MTSLSMFSRWGGPAVRDGEELIAFSHFVGALNEARAEHDGPELLTWAADRLSEIIGFDAAWCGWADMMPADIEIIGTQTLNLPEDYVAFWSGVRDDDILAGDVKSAQGKGGPNWATYDRGGARQTDGMVALSDRFGLRQLSVVTRPVDPLRPQLFISAYRGGTAAPVMQQRELTFLACALDHMQSVLDRHRSRDDSGLRLLVDRQGRPVAGSAQALGLWSGWRDAPERPRDFAAFLEDSGLHVVSAPAPVAGGHVLTELRIAPHRLSDRLSARERDIASLIAEGHTHKEIARELGLAPATVRNQTARIYAKAGVTSRAALTRALMETG